MMRLYFDETHKRNIFREQLKRLGNAFTLNEQTPNVWSSSSNILLISESKPDVHGVGIVVRTVGNHSTVEIDCAVGRVDVD